MTKNTHKWVHLIYGIVLSVLLALVAALFIIMCVRIYNSGASPFTRESISAHFSKISVFVYITIAAILGSIVVDIVFPLEPEKIKGQVKDGAVLRRFLKKNMLTSPVTQKIEKHFLLRFVLTIISIVLVLAASITSFVVVLTSFDASDAYVNGQVIGGTLTILRYFTLPFAYLVVTAIICKITTKKDMALVKDDIKNNKDVADKINAAKDCTFVKLTCELNDTCEAISKPCKCHRICSLIVKCGVGAVAVLFIILGIVNGSMADVLTKAINICTECIGLG